MIANQALNLLECTLRDGSYVVDFQFTARDTALICAALEQAGFRLIEIGHGLGLNAANMGKGAAAASDEAYMQAAANTLQAAAWGMFFIPGIGRAEDLRQAAQHKMSFVRIGTNADEVAQAEPYVQLAKKLDLFVSVNLMKSYALPPAELAQQAKLAQEFGADLVCLVDSAGCMLPEEVRIYMTELRQTLSVPLGFHGHDNLSLGMANVLTAIECGAQVVDSTLQGMGRGGGNPVSEVLVTVLKRRGIDLGIDVNYLMDISARLIKPMLRDKGWDALDVTSGYAGFHSSYLKTVLKHANAYRVDPRDLIVKLCEIDQVHAPDDLVERIARQLQQAANPTVNPVKLANFTFSAANKASATDHTLTTAVQNVAREIRTIASKRGRLGVMNLVAPRAQVGKAVVSPFIQEEFDYVIGSVEIDNFAQLQEIVQAVGGGVDLFFVDADVKPYLQDRSLADEAKAWIKHSQLLGYKDSDVWVRSVEHQMRLILGGLVDCPITISGADPLALKLTLLLLEQGAAVTLTADRLDQFEAIEQTIMLMSHHKPNFKLEADIVLAARGAKGLVAFANHPPALGQQAIEALPAAAVIFDAGIGALSVEAIAAGHRRGISIARPDMRAALAAEISLAMGAQKTVTQLMGRGEILGILVVAGGWIGQYGEVVVDSVSNPAKVLGIADGQGKVIYEPAAEFRAMIAKIEGEILRRATDPLQKYSA